MWTTTHSDAIIAKFTICKQKEAAIISTHRFSELDRAEHSWDLNPGPHDGRHTWIHSTRYSGPANKNL